MLLASEQILTFTRDLLAVVGAGSWNDDLEHVAAGLAEALQRLGLPVDRIQLPLSAVFGLKQPIYNGIVLTWTSEGGSNAWLRVREGVGRQDALDALAKSPFGPLLHDGEEIIRRRRDTPAWDRYELLREMGSIGYTDYIALATPLPDGARQVISVATRHSGGFDDGVPAKLRQLAPIIALALYALYQGNSAQQIARTYVGHRTGQRVLEGAMGRGQVESITAAVAFIDGRNFTAISRELGARRVLPLLNEVFDAIADAVEPQLGLATGTAHEAVRGPDRGLWSLRRGVCRVWHDP